MVKHTIIRRYLASYLLLLIIPIIASVVIYYQTSSMVEDDLIASNLQVLDDSRIILDKELENLDLTMKRLATSGDVNSFFNTGAIPAGSPEYFKVIRASYMVHSYSINTDFIDDIYLYAKGSDIILTTQRVHTELENDYPFYFQFGNMSYKMWDDAILNAYYHHSYLPETVISFAGESKAVIPFIQSVPFHNRKYSKGNIIGFIDLGILHPLLGRLNHEGLGKVYLIDEEGEILTTVGNSELPFDPISLLKESGTSIENQVIDREEWLVSQTTSNITGFKVLSVLPSSYIGNKISYIKNIIIVITLAILVSGLLISIYLSYRNSKPVLEIADLAKQQLENSAKQVNDFDLIKSSMTRLIRSNNELSEYKRRQLPVGRNSYLERLLLGTTNRGEDTAVMLKYHEIQLGEPPYNVVLVSIRGYGSLINDDILNEKDLIMIIIMDAMRELFSEAGYYVQLDPDTLAWVYREDSLSVKQRLLTLHERLRKENDVDVLISRGKPHQEVRELALSFTEAEKGMEYLRTLTRGVSVSNYDELPERSDSFSYSVDHEAKLSIFVKTGQLQETSRLLDEIFEENFIKRELSFFMMNQLLRSLLNTLIRLNEFFLEEGIARKELNAVSSFSSAEEEFTELRRLFTTLVLKAADLKDTEQKHLRAAVIAYMDQEYANQNINLSMLADHFGYKESYLYHFFMDTVGQSFASYLESIRLAKACELLQESSESIDSIAESIGYCSSHSFRRAFKRRYDVSPSLYKKGSITSIIL